MFRPLFYRTNILVMIAFALGYYLVQVYLFNFHIINDALVGSYSLPYKATLIGQLIKGHLQMFPLSQQVFLITLSLLVGGNLMLLLLRFQKARSMGGVKLSVGGASMLAVVSSGCPSCGLTIFSLLGPSSSIASMILRNPLFQVGIFGLLLLSIYLSLNTLQKERCLINARGR